MRWGWGFRSERGRLVYSTDDIGTIDIEWEDVARLTSSELHEVETEDGERFIGSIQPGPTPESMVVVDGPTSVTFDLPSIIRSTPLGQSWLDRVDGFVDFGFNCTKANRSTQWTLGSEATYRGRKWLVRTGFDALLSDVESADATTRQDLNVQLQRFLGDRWVAFSLGSFQQNEQLALELRSLLAGGVGHNVVQSNRIVVTVVGGLVLSPFSFASSVDRSLFDTFAGLCPVASSVISCSP